jgi:hypothetical protein
MTNTETRVVRYRCGTMSLTVPLLRLVATVSGVGSEESEDVVLAEECSVAAKCPAWRAGRCPLDSADAP